MVNYKEMIQIIKSKYPDFERKLKEDEENDTSKAWGVPGIFYIQLCYPRYVLKCITLSFYRDQFCIICYRF